MKISSAEGIGFAIPINVVKPIINSYIDTNDYVQATIGIYAYDKDVIPYLNSNISFPNGIYVSQIIKNGPSDKTELKEGDIINSIDGIPLNTMNDLREYIYSKKPNEVVTLKISRGKIVKDINIVLRKKIKAILLRIAFGAPGGIRTPDLPVRSRTLYPAKLLVHFHNIYYTLIL